MSATAPFSQPNPFHHATVIAVDIRDKALDTVQANQAQAQTNLDKAKVNLAKAVQFQGFGMNQVQDQADQAIQARANLAQAEANLAQANQVEVVTEISIQEKINAEVEDVKKQTKKTQIISLKKRKLQYEKEIHAKFAKIDLIDEMLKEELKNESL